MMTDDIGDANDMDWTAKAAELLPLAADLLDKLQGIGLTVPAGRDHFGRSHVANSALQITSEALSTVHAQALAGQAEAVAAARVEGIKEGTALITPFGKRHAGKAFGGFCVGLGFGALIYAILFGIWVFTK